MFKLLPVKNSPKDNYSPPQNPAFGSSTKLRKDTAFPYGLWKVPQTFTKKPSFSKSYEKLLFPSSKTVKVQSINPIIIHATQVLQII